MAVVTSEKKWSFQYSSNWAEAMFFGKKYVYPGRLMTELFQDFKEIYNNVIF